MGNEWVTHRTIIEEPKATQSIEKLTEKHERFDDQWTGFSWLLSRSPELGRKKTFNGDVYYLMHRVYRLMRDDAPNHGLVEIAVVYKFDDKTVTLIDVNAWEVEES